MLTFSCLPIGTAEAGFCTFAVRQSCLLCPVAGPGGIVASKAAAGGLELRPEPALEAAPDFRLAGFCTRCTGCDSIPRNIVQAMLCCRCLFFVWHMNITPSLHVLLIVPVVAPSSPSTVQEHCSACYSLCLDADLPFYHRLAKAML